MKFQSTCPSCGAFVWTTADAVGQQTNCDRCHKLFRVEAPAPRPSARAKALRLLPDPLMQRDGLDAYQVLGQVDVGPASSLASILAIPYPADDDGIAAYDKLSNLQTRLQVDALMYPIWHSCEGMAHGTL